MNGAFYAQTRMLFLNSDEFHYTFTFHNIFFLCEIIDIYL